MREEWAELQASKFKCQNLRGNFFKGEPGGKGEPGNFFLRVELLIFLNLGKPGINGPAGTFGSPGLQGKKGFLGVKGA